jgi:hypothetical protein
MGRSTTEPLLSARKPAFVAPSVTARPTKSSAVDKIDPESPGSRRGRQLMRAASIVTGRDDVVLSMAV